MQTESQEEVTPKAVKSQKAKEGSTTKTSGNAQAKRTAKQIRVCVTAARLNVREKASLASPILATLEAGEVVHISSKQFGFGKLADSPGYIKLEFTQPEQ